MEYWKCYRKLDLIIIFVTPESFCKVVYLEVVRECFSLFGRKTAREEDLGILKHPDDCSLSHLPPLHPDCNSLRYPHLLCQKKHKGQQGDVIDAVDKVTALWLL